jgi:hypothetical protein
MRLSLPMLAASLAAGLALSGCSTVEKNTGACPVPPLPQSEIRPKPPVSEHQQIWQPGHWDWNGSAYSWRPGQWILRSSVSSNQWFEGNWTRDQVPGPCHWVPAHWM